MTGEGVGDNENRDPQKEAMGKLQRVAEISERQKSTF